MNKYYIKTYGCQMNSYDSSKISDILKVYKKMSQTNNVYDADILILNTCSIREKSQEKVFSELGYWKKVKDVKKNILICVCGCVASQEGENILKRAPYVDIIFGPQTIHKLIQMILNVKKNKKKQIDISFPEIEKYDFFPKPSFNQTSAFVSVQEGCNKFCSYCIVPFTRGKEINRKFEDVIYECFLLSDQGVKEIILLGQNVNAYFSQKKNGDQVDLAMLIFYISQIDGIERIDFTTSHPLEFSDNLIQAYEYIPELVNHVHLPVQSGSNKILKAMKRGYSIEQYKEKIFKLKEIKSNITIGSDFIVGFPGETHKDFQDTMSLIKQIKFAQSFSFLYSKRPGTPAENIQDNISYLEKKNRLRELQILLKKNLLEINKTLLNGIHQILVTHISKTNKKELIGKTKNNRIVKFEGKKNLIGKNIEIKVTDYFLNSFKGKILH